MQHGDTVRANVWFSGLPASHNTRQQLGNVVHDANVFLLQQCMNIHAIHVHYSLLLKYFYMDSQKRKHIHIINQELKFTYSILTAIFPGEPGLASCPLNSPQIRRKFIFGLQIRHITSNWIILFCGEGQRSRSQRTQAQNLYSTRMHTNIPSNLSLRFNCHFPGGPGLAGARMSPFWILLELRMMEWWWQLEL